MFCWGQGWDVRQTAGYLRTFEKNNKLPNNEMIGCSFQRFQGPRDLLTA